MKRPEKVSFKLVRPTSTMIFNESLGKASIYVAKLNEAVNSDHVIQVAEGDTYMLQQLRAAAKKIPLRLVFAKDNGCVFVKPIRQSGEEDRLVALLREPRTVDELRAKRLELDIEGALQRLARGGFAHIFKGKWVLTESGMDLVPKAKAAVA